MAAVTLPLLALITARGLFGLLGLLSDDRKLSLGRQLFFTNDCFLLTILFALCTARVKSKVSIDEQCSGAIKNLSGGLCLSGESSQQQLLLPIGCLLV